MSYQKTYRIIKPKKWYIVDTYRPDAKGKPRMLKKEFDNRKQVTKEIARVIEHKKENKFRFEAIKGEDAIYYGLYILNAEPNLKMYLRKYNYDSLLITREQRKVYRTRFRRHQRKRRGELYKKWG